MAGLGNQDLTDWIRPMAREVLRGHEGRSALRPYSASPGLPANGIQQTSDEER